MTVNAVRLQDNFCQQHTSDGKVFRLVMRLQYELIFDLKMDVGLMLKERQLARRPSVCVRDQACLSALGSVLESLRVVWSG